MHNSFNLSLGRRTVSLRAVRDTEAGSSIKTSSEARPNGWEAYFLELNTPIVFTSALNDVIVGEGFRLYPPTQISNGRAPEIMARSAYIPAGTPQVNQFQYVDYQTSTGFSFSINQTEEFPVFYCYGLRIDVREELVDVFRIQRRVLLAIRSICLQWWLLDSLNPFDLKVRFTSTLIDDRSLIEVSRSGELRLPTQTRVELCGVEKALGPPQWSYLRHVLMTDAKTDLAQSLFCDALARFYNFDDASSTLHLALSLEAAEAGARRKTGRKVDNNPLRNLKKDPLLLGAGDYHILKKLFVDRGHIAHAESPPNLSADKEIITRYIAETVRIFVAREISNS